MNGGGKTDGLKRLDFGRLLEVVQSVLHIVYGHASVYAIKSTVGKLWHTLVSTISCFEVPAILSAEPVAFCRADLGIQHCSPIVLSVSANGSSFSNHVRQTEKSSLNWHEVQVLSPGISFAGSMVTLNESCHSISALMFDMC